MKKDTRTAIIEKLYLEIITQYGESYLELSKIIQEAEANGKKKINFNDNK